MTCSLYRFRGGGGELLYVGITDHLPGRLAEHSKKQPWWDAVRAVEVEHFQSREEARAAEQAAIDNEGPTFNVYRSLGKMPLHSFRVDDELWNAGKERASGRGESLGDALRGFLEEYVNE